MLTQILLLVTSTVSAVLSSEYPVGLDPANCPNYPFCGDSPPAVKPQNSPRIYPNSGDSSTTSKYKLVYFCHNYPFCDNWITRQIPTEFLLPRAYPNDVDPSLCPNYPFCEDSGLKNSPRSYPADVDPSSCPNYPYCDQDVVRQLPPNPLPAAYPADVDPSSCPNYPNCHQGIGREVAVGPAERR